MQEQTIGHLAELLEQKTHIYHDYEFPQVSVIIPVHNCAQKIAVTLESVLTQNYPDFEVVLIAAESTDRTLEVVKGFRDERVRVFTVSSHQRYAMLNHGISQAKGKYLNFLFPGDFYLYTETLKVMMTLALEEKLPHLLFCGTLLRDGKSEVKILNRTFDLKILRRGQQPSSLQSFWFRRDLFQQGKGFDTTYSLRGGYELLCRLYQQKELRIGSTTRVLTDYDLRWVTHSLVMTHFWETMRIIWTYYGGVSVLRWLFYQKDIKRFGKLWWHSLRIAFTGR